MNATLSSRIQTWGGPERRVIRGVCAHVAERAGVPVWMPRAAFVIFGLLHWLLAIIAYVVLVRVLGLRRRAVPFVAAPDGPPVGAVRDRFSALDARLAAMEAASLQQETDLRRAFRDLERGQRG